MNPPDICSPPVSRAFYLLPCQNRKGTKIQICSITLTWNYRNTFAIGAQSVTEEKSTEEMGKLFHFIFLQMTTAALISLTYIFFLRL